MQRRKYVDQCCACFASMPMCISSLQPSILRDNFLEEATCSSFNIVFCGSRCGSVGSTYCLCYYIWIILMPTLPFYPYLATTIHNNVPDNILFLYNRKPIYVHILILLHNTEALINTTAELSYTRIQGQST